ncbi:Wax synthase domain-containing protein [Hirschfeldia incana]|nr:Wax synthase domain-containing protein [Hirschfeldia incana]
MDEEIIGFVIVWILAVISVSYCYYISSRIKAGVLRLISVVPVCAFFQVLPLFFSYLHLSSCIAVSLSCLASAKLVLFSFDQGSLFPLPSNIFRFICFTCLPIKAQQNPRPKIQIPKWLFPIKVAIFAMVLHMYDHQRYMSPVVLLVLYVLHLYLELDIALMLVKFFVFITLGCDLEPQANEPYLSTSLHDFWGRRWNLMVPAILRPAIFVPVRQFCRGRMSSDWATFLAALATFSASGVAHEVFFFALTFEMPTGEVTCFFVLHGVCTAAEVAVKRTAFVRRWRMSPVLSRLLTVGFVVVTSGWLLFPTLARSNMLERAANEVLLSIDYVKRTFYSFG